LGADGHRFWETRNEYVHRPQDKPLLLMLFPSMVLKQLRFPAMSRGEVFTTAALLQFGAEGHLVAANNTASKLQDPTVFTAGDTLGLEHGGMLRYL